MDAAKALGHAFSAGLKVRGVEQQAVAGASLVMHGARTLDPDPFLERGKALIAPAMAAFRKGKRADLELRVAMWLSDGGHSVDVSETVDSALRAYKDARAWTKSVGGEANLAWIRHVPRDEATASIVVERLFDHALAAGDEARRAAEAVLEANLADFPRASSYSVVFRAAALSESGSTIDRTIAGLGTVHPSDDNPGGRKRLEALRVALTLAKMEAEGQALEDALERYRAPVLATGLAPHLAAALSRKSKPEFVPALITDAEESAGPGGNANIAALAFVRRHTEGPRKERDSVTRRLLASGRGLQATALVAGACEASRAVRDAWPAVDVASALTGDSLGPLATASTRASFQKALFTVGGEAAAATGDRETVAALAQTLKAAGLSPPAETYLRARLADAAAGVAARAGDSKAYDLAQKIVARSRDKFERAKLEGRIAMEFVRATEVPPMPVRWLDPLFDGEVARVAQ